MTWFRLSDDCGLPFLIRPMAVLYCAERELNVSKLGKQHGCYWQNHGPVPVAATLQAGICSWGPSSCAGHKKSRPVGGFSAFRRSGNLFDLRFLERHVLAHDR